MIFFLLTLIFARPFISSLAFPVINNILMVLLLGCLVLWVVYKKNVASSTRQIYPIILFFISAILIALLFSLDKRTSLNESFPFLNEILLLVVCGLLSYKERIFILYCVILSGLVISVLAVYQFLFGWKHILDYMGRNNITDRFITQYLSEKHVFFPFVTPNILGGYLAMLFPLTLLLRKRLMFIPILFIITIIMTRSVDAMLTLAAGLSVFLFLQRRQNRKPIIGLILFLSAVIVVIAIVKSMRRHSFMDYILSSVVLADLWGETLLIIKGRFLTGVGLGNLVLSWSTYTHNSYLQFWAETGIIGLAAFGALLWQIFRIGYEKIKKASLSSVTSFMAAHPAFLMHRVLDINKLKANPALLAAVFFTAGLIFAIHNILYFSLFLPEVSMIWWLIIGIMVSL